MTLGALKHEVDSKNRYDRAKVEEDVMRVFDWGPGQTWDEPEVHDIELAKLPALDWRQVKAILSGGKDVESYTRVTGYFSRMASWNKGKQAEGRDRARVKVA